MTDTHAFHSSNSTLFSVARTLAGAAVAVTKGLQFGFMLGCYLCARLFLCMF